MQTLKKIMVVGAVTLAGAVGAVELYRGAKMIEARRAERLVRHETAADRQWAADRMVF